ncbi:MAG: hypothetical protein WA864_14825 [Acetobacteraceae bacterium]
MRDQFLVLQLKPESGRGACVPSAGGGRAEGTAEAGERDRQRRRSPHRGRPARLSQVLAAPIEKSAAHATPAAARRFPAAATVLYAYALARDPAILLPETAG